MHDNCFTFSASPEVVDLGIKVAGVVVGGINNELSNPEFIFYKQGLLEDLRARYGENGGMEGDPVIQGYHRLHNRIGCLSKKLIPSPEALITYFLKHGDVPVINPLVDLYNCISLESRLSIGAHDLEKVQGGIALRLSNGEEPFLPLGKTKVEKAKAGEYCYFDGSDEILCRLECRQSDKTKIDTSTKDCFFIVQGHEYTSSEYLLSVTSRLKSLITTYYGGRERETILVDGSNSNG